MKKIVLSIFAFVCLFIMSSCEGNPAYTYEEVFGKEASEVEKNSVLLGSILQVVITDDGLRLSPVGPLMEDKIYINAPDRTPKAGDEALIYKKDDNTFYFYYSENDGTGRTRRAKKALKWCEQNIK